MAIPEADARARRSEAGVNEHKRWRMLPTLAVAGFLLLLSAAAHAGSVVVTIIDGTKARADITLPNPGGGNYTAEFELEFEANNLQNLTVQCIGITADVLTPAEIADIEQNHLPHPWQSIDTNFPVRVTVEPPSGCGLAFEDQYEGHARNGRSDLRARLAVPARQAADRRRLPLCDQLDHAGQRALARQQQRLFRVHHHQGSDAAILGGLHPPSTTTFETRLQEFADEPERAAHARNRYRSQPRRLRGRRVFTQAIALLAVFDVRTAPRSAAKHCRTAGARRAIWTTSKAISSATPTISAS